MFSKRKRTVTHSIAEGRGSAACCGIPATGDYPARFSARPERKAVPRAGEQNIYNFGGKKNDDDRAVPLLHNGK